MPVRIQLRRVKGWKLPAGAVVVSRTSVYGNPWTLAEASEFFKPEFAAAVVTGEYRNWLLRGDDPECLAKFPLYRELHPKWKKLMARLPDLVGKDVACFCPLGSACHGDVLLELVLRLTWRAHERDG